MCIRDRLQGRVHTLKERKPQRAVIAATQKETVQMCIRDRVCVD